MPLINLKTNLKSLRYGGDQRGGGSSNQPYVVTPIPDGYYPTSPDFLLRNGILNPQTSATDISRLTKWFTDTKSPSGILFTAKQTLLERQNVKIPGGFNRIYNPAGTLIQAGTLSIGSHTNKQGLNPFQSGYFNGGGNGYYQNNTPGIGTLGGEGSKRLMLLYSSKQLPPGISSNMLDNVNTYDISSNPNILLSYSGGPNSILGIGNTNIKFTGTGRRERTNNYVVLEDAEKIYNRFGNLGSILSDEGQNILTPEPQLKRQGTTTLTSLNSTYNPYIKDFNRETTYSTLKTDYKISNDSNGPNYDFQNLSPVETTTDYIDGIKYRDLIKFYFEIINNDNKQNWFLFFRAYLNNLGDGFKAEWGSFKYIGNAQTFYKYSGFNRDISLSFTIYAHSRAEMVPLYEKLNYLVGVTAPSYSEPGLMRGNFIRVNVGDYLNNIPCIIQSINLKPNLEAGWDLNRTKEGNPITDDNGEDLDVGQLPRMIEIDMTLTPIFSDNPKFSNTFIGGTPIFNAVNESTNYYE